ncbi:cryptochrome/photolyase family protein [Pacificimonas flava]|uniref:Cryptochrome/photolyase family protein n=2 Tax=Pacificimonas TaxID=1960290 RepID=A0A219B6J0_9SPHN|nr:MULTISPECIES: cryptochrome/photolyase family protein [Pacificimonas]MBZ6378756.1 cryptochrome/photolyase family protein [Pacificimonas aurantium]OWV33980.1 cryptochrome/photolyase family protein [Pacificimonas flava]
MTRLVYLLGDQLTRDIASLRGCAKDDTVILMAELDEETTYVAHHKQKLVFILSAMRHFAEELRQAGWSVDYVPLTDEANSGSFTGELARALERYEIEEVRVVKAGEWRVQQMIEEWPDRFAIPVRMFDDDRFICSLGEFAEWAEGRTSITMEYFYRQMRRKTGLLMTDAGDPAGERWNFDKENRKPADDDLFMPQRPTFEPDGITHEVMELVAERFPDNIGTLDRFDFAVTRDDAENVLDRFIADALPRFGTYQDAMLTGESFLYHAVISPYLNIGFLDPLDVCRRVQQAWQDGDAPLNAAEGFIRQIIGWREFVRGLYWREMPDYRDRNFLNADRNLPSFYWTGETDMHCLSQAVGQTVEHAYAHHIQRLMITGNFALLIGADPRQVHEWYLEVYADAYEWVELPNTLGMSQFGDGGLLGTKPYASSGNYINKMSDYCGRCTYDVNRKTGEGACPFNALYWHFLDRNRDKLGDNRRLAMPYRSWDRMDEKRRDDYRQSARSFLKGLR